MFTPVLRLSVVTLTVLALLTLVPFLAGAQERNSSDANTIEAESSATLEANYNNSRSNRSTISVSGETNVCDGATCPDGSCAATADQCNAEEMAADSVCNGYLCDDGQCVSDEAWCGIDFDFEVGAATAADSVCNGYLCNDGTCASSEAMCGITFEESASSVATCPAGSPIRCGDGSCSSEVDRCLAIESQIREGGRTIDAGNAPEQNRVPTDADGDGMPDVRDEDSDDDGLDDGTERAQDYNSSRSNKPSRAIFSDTDADGVPDVSMRADGFIKIGSIEGEATSRVRSGEVVCWGRAEDEDGKVYAWGRGLCVAADATADAEGVAQDRIAALQVRGDEVRGWSEAERAAWREYVTTRATTSPEERLAVQAIERTQANERIQEITSDDEGLNVRYRSQLRLFGLIPLERDVDARIDAAGEVIIDYPWYRILSSTPDTGTIRELMSSLVSVSGGGGAGKVSI